MMPPQRATASPRPGPLKSMKSMKYTETYETLKIKFINGPLSVAQIDQQIDSWVTQITEAHQEASNLYENTENEETWMNEINLFKAQLNKARQR